MKRVFAAMAAALGLAACGGSSTTPQSGPQQFEQAQKPVSPKSVIAGRVIDAATQGPLDGVSVRAVGLSETTTAADGTFKIENIVAGSTVTLVLEKMGYVRVLRGTTTPAAAGNSPLEGGLTTVNAELFPAACSVSGFVFLPNGRPASGATVFVDQASVAGESVVTGQTMMDGAFSLSGLGCRPAGTFHTVHANWFDENGDMQADYAGVNQQVRVYPGQTARVFLTYSASSVGNRVIASNVIDGEVAATEELTFTFALPLVTSSFDQDDRDQFELQNLTRSTTVPVEGTFMSPTQLRVRPANMSLREGERYRLSLSLRNANTTSGTGSTYLSSFDFQVRPAVVMPFNVVVSGVTVLNPSPQAPFGADKFNFDSNSFEVSFNPAAGAVRYEIFARDQQNPNYVFLTSVDASSAPRLLRTVSLPNSFDMVPSPGVQPLAFGNTVTFAVVAVDVYGNRSPFMTAMAVTVRDEIPPTLTAGPTVVPDATGGTSIDANNETTTPAVYRVRFTYSEPMDVTTAGAPTFTSAASTAPMAAWSWDPTDLAQRRAILTLTIAPNTDSTGSFLIRGGRDSSGNQVAQAGDIAGSLGGRRELLQNGNFQMGNSCSLTGWGPTNTNSTPVPVTVPNNGAIAGSTSPCAALLGSPPGSAPSTGRARITQDVALPTTMMTGFSIEASARTRPAFTVNRATPGASYSMSCRVETVALPAMVLGSLGGFVSGFSDVTTAAYTLAGPVFLTGQGGNSVRVVCESDNATTFAGNGAFYVDEISVALVRPGTLSP